MIRTLPHHLAAPISTRPAAASTKSTAQTAGKITTSSADFRSLLQPATATPSAKVSQPSGEVPHLGPFTGDPYMHPADPPPQAPDKITSSPWLPSDFKGDTDLMNKTQHESTMNAWLQNYTKWSNDNKTQIYQQTMANWQLNNQRCQELGLKAPPKPAPPTLDPVQPMPEGYWFKS